MSSSSSSSDGACSSSESGPESKDAKQAKKKGAKENKEEVIVDSNSDSDADSDSEEKPPKKRKKESSSDDSSSEEEEERAKKKRKKKKDGKDKKAKKKQKKEGSKKGKKKDKKDKKKILDKKGKKLLKKKKKMARANRDAVSNQFGKYGIIKQEDFFNKKPEFLLWAMEVKKENTDAMGQMKQKDLFKEYIEDYNTATMPSKKFYNLQVWDNQETSKRSKKKRGDDMTDAQKAALASFDDERARREEIKHMQAKKQEMSLTDEVRKLRSDKGKVEEMKHQNMMRTQLDIANRTGNTKESDKIKERLDPGRDELGRPLTALTLAKQKMGF